MSEFAPWTDGAAKSTPSRPDSSHTDVRAAAVRSMTQHVNSGADQTPQQSPPNRMSNTHRGGRSRRGSTATALVTGMADVSEGWTPGTVPAHVDLILLSEEDVAMSPNMDRRSPHAGGVPNTATTNGTSGGGVDALPSMASPGQTIASRDSARQQLHSGGSGRERRLASLRSFSRRASK